MKRGLIDFVHIGKRAVAPIITVLLIITILIGGTAAFWLYVYPSLEDSSIVNSNDVQLSVQLEGYTGYDKEHKMVFVQVARKSDSENVVALEFSFVGEEGTYNFRTTESINRAQEKIFVFDLGREDILDVPEKVKIYPIIEDNGVAKRGGVAATRSIPNVKMYLTDSEWDAAVLDARDSYLNEDIEGEVIFGCTANFENGKSYTLVKDVETSGDCFVIEANDVTLNLNRRALTSLDEEHGVIIKGDRVVVKNGDFFDFGTGVLVDGTDSPQRNATINNNKFDNVGVGIFLQYTEGNFIHSNNFENSWLGTAIQILGSEGNKIEYNYACDVGIGVDCTNADGASLANDFGSATSNSFSNKMFCNIQGGVDFVDC